jgi:hypothetical protein
LRSTHEIVEAVHAKTGWKEQDISKSYTETVKYRRLVPEDLDEDDTWVDVASYEGKPLLKNIGTLR